MDQDRPQDVLVRHWLDARRGRGGPPLYDDVVLGNLGRQGTRTALLGEVGDGPGFLWAGELFEAWLGRPAWSTPLSALDPSDERAFGMLRSSALASGEPVRRVHTRVQDGVVETVDLMGLPVANRWGTPLVLIHSDLASTRTNLLDAIFKATGQGLIALAALRDVEGQPTDFRIVALNEGAAGLMGEPSSALVWRSLSRLVPDPAWSRLLTRLTRVVATGHRETFEYEIVHSGRPNVSLKIEAGALGDLVALTLTDIGDIKAQEASYRLLFQDNPMPMWLQGAQDGRFLAVNRAAVTHYGFDEDRFLQMCADDLHRLPAAPDRAEPSAAGRNESHLTAMGTEIDVVAYSRPLPYAGRPAVLVASIDVTERRRAEARVAHLARHDFLTGLPNRVQFVERLEEALSGATSARDVLPGEEPAQPLHAVLCIDLDGFKAVNDTYGHPVGDELLKGVAARLCEAVPGEGSMICRLGGDEFAVLTGALHEPGEAGALAERIIEAVGMPFRLTGTVIHVGASIGIAFAPTDAESAERLFVNADLALYRAKNEGRRTYRCFEPEMDARLQERCLLERDLRAAVAADELDVHYQPLLQLDGDRITGCEALVRWRRADGSFTPPSDFVPIAEEIGLIGEIGERVLRTACVEATSWPSNVKIAVNLSSAQFRDGDRLVDSVARALAASGLAPHRLELEITESILLGETRQNIRTLHRLRALGARIAMDDFGTGYSSLGYLRSFPFDKIKIDKSFIRDLAQNPDCAAIIGAVTSLGSTLGITTTAEGVETADQLEGLRLKGCDEVQGFLISRPISADDIRRLLSHHGDHHTDMVAAA